MVYFGPPPLPADDFNCIITSNARPLLLLLLLRQEFTVSLQPLVALLSESSKFPGSRRGQSGRRLRVTMKAKKKMRCSSADGVQEVETTTEDPQTSDFAKKKKKTRLGQGAGVRVSVSPGPLLRPSEEHRRASRASGETLE